MSVCQYVMMLECHNVMILYLCGEKHTPDDLEDAVSPGAAGVGPHHGHQVADAEDGHHDDQGL